MAAARLPPKLAQPPTLRHSGKWAALGYLRVEYAQPGTETACELPDNGPSGVKFTTFYFGFLQVPGIRDDTIEIPDGE